MNQPIEGTLLKEQRTKYAEPGCPCERCKRDSCPPICFPRLDWQKRAKKKKHR